MSYEFYKILHLIGFMTVFFGTGLLAATYGLKVAAPQNFRRVSFGAHGIGLVLILLGGFGMLAKLGVGIPNWILVKLVIWLVLGGSVALLKRKSEHWLVITAGLLALGALAAFLGVLKPF